MIHKKFNIWSLMICYLGAVYEYIEPKHFLAYICNKKQYGLKTNAFVR